MQSFDDLFFYSLTRSSKLELIFLKSDELTTHPYFLANDAITIQNNLSRFRSWASCSSVLGHIAEGTELWACYFSSIFLGYILCAAILPPIYKLNTGQILYYYLSIWTYCSHKIEKQKKTRFFDEPRQQVLMSRLFNRMNFYLGERIS